MTEQRNIQIGDRAVEALAFSLTGKNLIVLRGSRGYIMCGYLDLEAAEKFNDAAVKITGVATIDDALKANVASCTKAAKALGIREGQAVQDVLRIIV
jgi:uncharacterized protein YunC (DUF1805 family)